MRTVITDAGISACLQAGMTGPKIEITKVKIGSQVIDITPDMTDVAGEVWSGGSEYINYQVQADDVFAFKVTLDEAIGDFDIGNIGLYTSDNVLFSLTVMDKPERKIKNAEDVVGNRKIIVVPIKLSGISQLINVSLLVPDESSIPFVQTQDDLPQVNLAAYSVYEIINHTEYNASALALRTPTKWVYIIGSGASGYSFPATMFDENAGYGSAVYYDTNTITFKPADGLDITKGFLGIRTEYNTLVTAGAYYNEDYHFNPGNYYYADGNANAGELTTIPNTSPVGYAVTNKVIIVGAMPETLFNKTQTIDTINPSAYKYPSEAAIASFGNDKADVDLYNTMFISDCCIDATGGVANYSGLTLTLPTGYKVLFSNGRDSTSKMVSIKYATVEDLSVSIQSTDDDYSVILKLQNNTASLVAVKTNILKYDVSTYTGEYYRKDFSTNKWYYCDGINAESEITMFVVWQGIVASGSINKSNPVYPINLMTGSGAGGTGGLVNVDNEPDFKNMIIQWMMPNLSAGVSVSSGWVANKNGWVVISRGYYSGQATAQIDGVKVWDSGMFDAVYGAGIVPIEIGKTLTLSQCSAIFYPCNGAS